MKPECLGCRWFVYGVPFCTYRDYPAICEKDVITEYQTDHTEEEEDD